LSKAEKESETLQGFAFQVNSSLLKISQLDLELVAVIAHRTTKRQQNIA